MLSPRNMLSPRPSLANWSPFEKLKSKIKILENSKTELKAKIEEQEKEKNELISHLKQSKSQNQKLQEKVKDLGESYEIFKTEMVSQEDPFVLRLALEQSRKDFTKVVEEVCNCDAWTVDWILKSLTFDTEQLKAINFIFLGFETCRSDFGLFGLFDLMTEGHEAFENL